MKLARISFSDVRGFADRRWELAPEPSAKPYDVVVVTGPPASGKTRFLEAIIAGLEVAGPYLGIVRGGDWAYDARPATIDLGIWLDEEEARLANVKNPANATVTFTASGVAAIVDRNVSRVLSRYTHDAEAGKREYFAENRQLAWGARSDGLEPMEQGLLRPTKDPQKYSFLPRFLTSLRDDPARARQFAEKLELLSPTVRYTPAPDEDPTICFRSRRQAPLGSPQTREPAGSGILAPAHGLSTSEAEAVLLAATACLVRLTRSIVLLDTPELYVPEDRILPFVQSLLALGHDNQWIVATQSPALVGAMEQSSVIRLDPYARGAA